MEGWIKLHRKLLDWEWYDDINTTRLWIHILLSANHRDAEWRGKTVKAGSFVTTYDQLAEATKLTKNEVRTAISKLERSKNVTRKTTNKYQVVTVAKWEVYQDDEDNLTCSGADNPHAINTLLTRLHIKEECKNIYSRPNSASGDSDKQKKSFDHDSKPYTCATYLDKKIRDRLPSKPPLDEKHLQAWALTFDRMNRLDKQDWKLIGAVLSFSQQDEFWQKNILSADTFRKQFFKLLAKIPKEECE